MRPSFYPRMINGPFDDPCLFVPFLFRNRAILFDLGEIRALSSRDILKISHIFVSHTHLDHFAGFDRVLRVCLGREKILSLYGPEGFLNHVRGKLSGYCWNLVRQYENHFVIRATEVREDRLLSGTFPCRDGFEPSEITEMPFDGILLKEPSLSLSAVITDHGIPCLAFALCEQFHINILKDRVTESGLSVGSWLRTFKEAVFDKDPDSEFKAIDTNGNAKKFVLKELAENIAIISPGQKITYVTDTIFSESNMAKLIGLAKGSDYLFIEAAFSETDKELARRKYHLTARQAGEIAAKAGVRQFAIFHFSPRYAGMEEMLRQEADSAFREFSGSVSG